MVEKFQFNELESKVKENRNAKKIATFIGPTFILL